VDGYTVTLVGVGAAIFGASVLPLLLSDRPLSFPIIYVALGVGLFSLPLGLPVIDPLAEGLAAERATELVVIVSLMGAGLKLDRVAGWRTWQIPWRLIVIAMPLTIAGTAVLGWWLGALVPASALLLGSVLAPTDPVLAGDVQVGPPGGSPVGEDDVRFGLTAEAGLNDGMAFPFANAAIAMALAGSSGVTSWIGGWFIEDVAIKIAVGLVMGLIGGRAIGTALFRLTTTRRVAESAEGLVALATTLLVYGVTEMAHGYGFIAVFVAACTLRNHERDHEYHEVLHASAESIERLISAVLLLLLGGAIVGGVLGPLGIAEAAIALALVLVIRPLAGWLALLRTTTPRRERWAIAFFGIRGMGSVYYLAYALNHASFDGAEQLWATVAFTIVVSVVLHGVTAAPVIARLDARRCTTRRESGS